MLAGVLTAMWVWGGQEAETFNMNHKMASGDLDSLISHYSPTWNPHYGPAGFWTCALLFLPPFIHVPCPIWLKCTSPLHLLIQKSCGLQSPPQMPPTPGSLPWVVPPFFWPPGHLVPLLQHQSIHITCLVSSEAQAGWGREGVLFSSCTLLSSAWYTTGTPQILMEVNWNSMNECLEQNPFTRSSAACICIYGGEREDKRSTAEWQHSPEGRGGPEELRHGSQVSLFPSLAPGLSPASTLLCPWGSFSAVSNWPSWMSHSKALPGTFADVVFRQLVWVTSWFTRCFCLCISD